MAGGKKKGKRKKKENIPAPLSFIITFSGPLNPKVGDPLHDSGWKPPRGAPERCPGQHCPLCSGVTASRRSALGALTGAEAGRPRLSPWLRPRRAWELAFLPGTYLSPGCSDWFRAGSRNQVWSGVQQRGGGPGRFSLHDQRADGRRNFLSWF